MRRPTLLDRMLSLTAACAWLCAATPALAEGLVGGVRLDALPQHWIDDNGRPLELATLAGERVVVTMAYANCHRICPMTIDALKRLQANLDLKREEAQFVVVGYDPANEDAASWREYRRSHHLERVNWHFVTGSVEDTERFAHQLKFELWKYDEHVMHDSRVLVFDARGLLASEFLPGSANWSAAL